jgi:hypothetical protein
MHILPHPRLFLLPLLLAFFAFASTAHAVVYAPGATLDPACAPGPACTVRLITAYDEGAPATTSASVFDFVGAGVTVTSSSTLPGAVQISIPGSSGASNWLFSGGSAITPSSTVGIIVNASSSISLLNAANFNLGTGTI